ncbi:hypothetical protein SAMN04488123_103114 [Natribacillus halophilus]|uniref:Uncharacterized protein n=1 Tax=Natribacillus halophilus TaxID=549003 RepID=A0A1G8LJE1_9BACI|nr:hypothetical protein SAMN04488123_103114 [Natribacillus halophilus]
MKVSERVDLSDKKRAGRVKVSERVEDSYKRSDGCGENVQIKGKFAQMENQNWEKRRLKLVITRLFT